MAGSLNHIFQSSRVMKVITSILLISLTSCELFTINAKIRVPLDYTERNQYEMNACVIGAGKQLRFNGENWTLVNWTGSVASHDNCSRWHWNWVLRI